MNTLRKGVGLKFSVIALVISVSCSIAQADQKKDIENFLVDSTNIIKEHFKYQGEKLQLLEKTSDLAQKETILTELASYIRSSKEKTQALFAPELCVKYKEIVIKVFDKLGEMAKLHLDLVKLPKDADRQQTLSLSWAFNQVESAIDSLRKESGEEFNLICTENKIDCDTLLKSN